MYVINEMYNTNLNYIYIKTMKSSKKKQSSIKVRCDILSLIYHTSKYKNK